MELRDNHMKQFKPGPHYYINYNDYDTRSLNPFPLYMLHMPGMQLLMQYLNEKYQTTISQAISAYGVIKTSQKLLPSEKAILFHEPSAVSEKTYTYFEPAENVPWQSINIGTPKVNYLHIDHVSENELKYMLSKIPKNTPDHRQAFIVTTNGGHRTPALLVYIREAQKEALLYLDASEVSSEWLQGIEKKAGIKTYANHTSLLERKCFNLVELLIMARDITGKRPGTDEYIIEHVLDKLERRADPATNKVLLPNALLKSLRNISDVNQHIDLETIREAIHKEETLLDFRKRYERTVTSEDGKEKTVSSYLYEKSKKYAHIVAVQFYINEMELDYPLTQELKNEFIEQAKKITSLDELHDYAETFLCLRLKMDRDHYSRLAPIKTMLQAIEFALNEQIPESIKTEFTIRALQLPPELNYSADDSDAAEGYIDSSDEEESVASQRASPDSEAYPAVRISQLQLLAIEFFPTLRTTPLRSEYFASVQRKQAYLPNIEKSKTPIEEIGPKYDIDPMIWREAVAYLKEPLDRIWEDKLLDIHQFYEEKDILDFLSLNPDLGMALCEYFLHYYSSCFTVSFWSQLALNLPVCSNKIVGYTPLIQRFLERGELYDFANPDLFSNSDVLAYKMLKKYPGLFNKEEITALQCSADLWRIEQTEKETWKKAFASRRKPSPITPLELQPAESKPVDSVVQSEEALSESNIQLLLEKIHRFEDLCLLKRTLSSNHWFTLSEHLSLATVCKLVRGYADLETAITKLFPEKYHVSDWLTSFPIESLKLLTLEKDSRHDILHHSLAKFDNFIRRIPMEYKEKFLKSFNSQESALMIAWQGVSSQANFINDYISEEQLPSLVEALFLYFKEYKEELSFLPPWNQPALCLWRGYHFELSDFFLKLTIPKQIALINTPQIQSIIKEQIEEEEEKKTHIGMVFFTISLGIKDRRVFDHVASLFNLPDFLSFITTIDRLNDYRDWCTEDERLIFEKAFAPKEVPPPLEPVILSVLEHQKQSFKRENPEPAMPPIMPGSTWLYSWFNPKMNTDESESPPKSFCNIS
jgi:hypothetical protein